MKNIAPASPKAPGQDKITDPHRGGKFNQSYIKDPKTRNINSKDARLWMIANHLHVRFPRTSHLEFPDPAEKKTALLLNTLVRESVDENFWWIFLQFLVNTLVLYFYVPLMIVAQSSDRWGLWFLHGAVNIYFMFNIFHMNLHQGRFVPYCIQDRFSLSFLKQDSVFEQFSYGLVKLYSCIFARHHQFWRQTHHDHHIYTNDPENDTDRLTSDKFFSVFPSSLRVFAVMLGYCLNGPKIILGNLPRQGYSAQSLAYFFGYVLTVFLVPTWMRINQGNGGFYEVFLAYCYVLAPTSLALALLFQVSHNHPHLTRPDRPRFPIITSFTEWVQNQLDQSVDWGGALACFFVGGINMQVEHHIAPAAPPMSLPTLQKKLLANGFRVYREPTFFHATWQHVKFIQQHSPYNPKEARPAKDQLHLMSQRRKTE